MKQKRAFWQQTQDVFGENRDEEYSMPTVKYTAGSYMLWAYFLLEVLDILFRYMVVWILSNTNI